MTDLRCKLVYFHISLDLYGQAFKKTDDTLQLQIVTCVRTFCTSFDREYKGIYSSGFSIGKVSTSYGLVIIGDHTEGSRSKRLFSFAASLRLTDIFYPSVHTW